MNYPHYPLPFGLLKVLSCLLLGCVASSNLQAQGSESTEVPPNPQLAKAQPTPTPGSIRGRVIYADTRRPVRHAGIYLAAINDDAEAEDEAAPPEIPNTVADLNGEFRFPKVTPGRYVVYPNDGGLVLLSNYPDNDLPLAERIHKGSLTEGFAEVYVKSGQETKVELTGRRSAAITGRVLYSDGSPVAGANVLIFRPGDKETLNQVTVGLTDSRGIYRVSNLPGGEYIVAAHDRHVETSSEQDQKQAFSSGLLVSAYYPSAKVRRKAKSVQVPDSGDAENIDITLPDPQMRNISGTVELKIKGRPPLARVQVQLIPLENEPGQPPQPSPLFTGNSRDANYSVFSDDTGSWQISSVPEGVYQLRFDGDISNIAKPSDTPATPETIGETPKSGALSAIREVTVKDSDITDLHVELTKGGSLSITVSAVKGLEMAGYLTIRAVRIDDEAPAEAEYGYCHVASGEPMCNIVGLVSGSYILEASLEAEEERPIYIKSVTLKNLEITKTPLKVAAGQTIKGLRVLISASFGAIGGKVYSDRQSKKAVSGKLIILMPTDALTRKLWVEPEKLKTDSDGGFSFTEVVPGDYFLFVGDSKTTYDEGFWRKNGAKLPHVLLKEGAELKNQEVFIQ